MFARTKSGWIGVDIGSRAIKLAQIARQGKTFSLVGAASVERAVPVQAASSTIAASEPLLTGAAPSCLQQIQSGLVDGGGFRGQQAAAVLSMQYCEYLGESVESNLRRGDLQAIAEELLGRDFQSLDELEFDYWTSACGSDDAYLHVLAAPTALAERVSLDQRQSRLTCVALDAAPFALVRAFQLSGGDPATPTALVDWGYHRVTFLVALGGQPYFVRCLPIPGFREVLRSVRETFSISEREADKLLVDSGLPATGPDSAQQELQNVVLEATNDHLEQLAEEVDRTFHYLNGHRWRCTPQSVVLFGGGAAIGNVGWHLETHWNRPVAPWSLPRGISPAETALPAPLLAQAIAVSSLAWQEEQS